MPRGIDMRHHMNGPTARPGFVGASPGIDRQRIEAAADAGVGTKQRDRPKLLFGFLDDVKDILLLADIAFEGGPADRPGNGARAESGNLIAWVEDSGPGLPEGDTIGIFERFKRGGAQEPEPGGLGLGLWISRSIVERHGGNIEATRTANDLTRFTITLPIEPQT